MRQESARSLQRDSRDAPIRGKFGCGTWVRGPEASHDAPTVTTPRRDYRRDELLIRSAFFASAGARAQDGIAARARCTAAIAFRVEVFRRAASLALETAWTEGAVTFRQAERIALLWPAVDEATAHAAEGWQLEAMRELGGLAAAWASRYRRESAGG
jgi:hypothetical protein